MEERVSSLLRCAKKFREAEAVLKEYCVWLPADENEVKPNKNLTSFTLFPELPTELRLEIWNHTMAPHDIRIGANGFFIIPGDSDRKVHSRSAPIALSVCKESREVALRRGHFYTPVDRPGFALPTDSQLWGEDNWDDNTDLWVHTSDWMSPKEATARAKWPELPKIWCDTTGLDTVYIPQVTLEKLYQMGAYPARPICVATDAFAAVSDLITSQTGTSNFFRWIDSGDKTVQYPELAMVLTTITVPHDQALSYRFNGAKTSIVALNDVQLPKMLAPLFRAAHRDHPTKMWHQTPHEMIRHLANVWSEFYTAPIMQDWLHTQSTINKREFSQHQDDDDLYSGDTYGYGQCKMFNREHAWCKKMLASMPVTRPAIAFELEPVPHMSFGGGLSESQKRRAKYGWLRQDEWAWERMVKFRLAINRRHLDHQRNLSVLRRAVAGPVVANIGSVQWMACFPA